MSYIKYLKEMFLKEKHLSELYHATTPLKVLKMLKSNSLKLTFQSGSDVMSKKMFYLSTMRVKYGNYANDHNSSVIININADAIKNVAKIKSVDYWGKLYHNAPYHKEEQEERIFSDKSSLSPLNKFVNEIHIYINPSHNGDIPKHIIYELSQHQTEIPIYFYNNEVYFKSQIKSKAISKNNIVNPNISLNDKEIYNSFFNNVTSSEKYIEALIQIYNNEEPDDKTYYNRVIDLLKRDDNETKLVLTSKIHNSKFDHPNVINDLSAVMKKERLHNFEDFIKLMVNKIKRKGK